MPSKLEFVKTSIGLACEDCESTACIVGFVQTEKNDKPFMVILCNSCRTIMYSVDNTPDLSRWFNSSISHLADVINENVMEPEELN